MARQKKHVPVRHAATAPIDSESDVVRQRLARIAEHYERVEQILGDLESRIPAADDDSARPKPR